MYRIKNITNLLDKRHRLYNTIVKIDHYDGFLKKEIELKPDMDIIMSHRILPLSIERLRMAGLILINQITSYTPNPIKIIEKKTEEIKIDIPQIEPIKVNVPESVKTDIPDPIKIDTPEPIKVDVAEIEEKQIKPKKQTD